MDPDEQKASTLLNLEKALERQIAQLQQVRQGLSQPTLEERLGNVERLAVKLKADLAEVRRDQRRWISAREIGQIVAVAALTWGAIHIASLLK